MKKYETTSNTKIFFEHELYQIKALKDFGNVKVGDLGGYIEKEGNLSQEGKAWIRGNALVCGDARVSGDAQIHDNALIFDNAKIYGNAWVYGNAHISDNAWVYGKAQVCGDAQVFDNAQVFGNAWISGNAQIYGDAQVCSDAQIYGDAQISSDTDYICFKGFGSENRNTTMFRTKNGDVMVKCGCFMGNLKEFERKVKKTHGNTKYAKEYLVCVEAAKIHFEIED